MQTSHLLFEGPRAALRIAERRLTLGLPLTTYAATTSTNDLALLAARADGEHGATFVAEAQTRGRGRRGRAWVSPPGENLTFSVLLRSRMSVARAQGLTLLAGLAVREAAAARVDAEVGIHWPNDLVCGQRKLAGILVESVVVGTELAAAAVGIGINVKTRELPHEIRGIATSLALLGAGDLDREGLLVDVLAALDRRLETFQEHGLDVMLDELRAHDALLGKSIRVGEIAGVASGIDTQGALLVLDERGTEHRVSSGTVERVTSGHSSQPGTGI